jgi:hypothetical protein
MSRSKFMNSPKWFIATASLLLFVPAEAPAQMYFGGGTSGDYGMGQALGIAAGVAVVVGVVYLVVHERHTITGCVQAVDGTSTLVDEKEKRKYTLIGSALQTGERLKLRGKRVKENDGNLTFRVERITNDYGACKP